MNRYRPQNMEKKIRVLVADDSAFMRKCLSDILNGARDIEVIDTARDGEEAVEKVCNLCPDVVTMDINMPRMDGITALQYIMDQCPCPVIMISSLTEEGALITFEALELGAIDFVTKPGGTISLGIKQLADEIVAKVRAAYFSNKKLIKKRASRQSERRAAKSVYYQKANRKVYGNGSVVVIGVSTGGPKTLMEILPCLPADFQAPVLVVQHMPPGFTESFAKHLDQCCNLPVMEARDGLAIESGMIVVAKGGCHLKVENTRGTLKAKLTNEPKESLYKPSVNVTMRSLVENVEGKKITAVLLTGMGDDGADMMVEIRKRGGYTIAESAETAVVFGMPRAAIERGGAEVIAPAHEIPELIIKRVKRYERS